MKRGEKIKEMEKLMADILHVQEGDWPKVETSRKPVLVDFWAEWCNPCRALAPTIDKLGEKYGNEVSFAKANVDEVPELASRFGIRSIPTLVLLGEGKVLERLVGLRSYEELVRLLDRYVTVGGRK